MLCGLDDKKTLYVSNYDIKAKKGGEKRTKGPSMNGVTAIVMNFQNQI